MFFNHLLPYEIPIMDTFIKYKVRQIVSILFQEYNGYIPRVEAPYLIRYFLQFPSQSQVVDEILPAIEKLESTTDKGKDLLELEAFEKHLLVLLKANQYASYDKETLIEAFRILDVEKNGFLDLHTFYAYIKSYGISYTKEQINEMEKFLLENDNELLKPLGTKGDEVIKHKPLTNRVFYYESYVRKVLSDEEKHFDSIMKEYKQFYDDYMETKKFPELPFTKPPQPEPEKKEERPEKKKTTKKGGKKGDKKEEEKKEEKKEENKEEEKKEEEKKEENKEEEKKEEEKKEEEKKEEEKKE